MTAVLYDASCTPCTLLARFMQKIGRKPFHYESWQEFSEKNPQLAKGKKPDMLRVWDGIAMHEGAQAWEWLLNQEPGLAKLRWLAVKIGLEREVAGALQKTGKVVRRLCWHCRR